MTLVVFMFIAALVLIGPALGLIPPIRLGRARNSMFTIQMPDRKEAYLDRWPAVLAQEVVEWIGAWIVAVVIGFIAFQPIAMILPAVMEPLVVPLVVLAVWSVRDWNWMERQLEYIGHAAEWKTGNSQGVEAYTTQRLEDFAFKAWRGYQADGGCMADVSAQDVHRGIIRMERVADLLLVIGRKRIERGVNAGN